MRVLPVGHSALLLEVGGLDEVHALHAELVRRRSAGGLPSLEEIVPGARTVLLDGVAAPRELARELLEWTYPPVDPVDGPLVEIPTVYDGWDLADVAEMWGVDVRDVAEIHAGAPFRVAFVGFAPGFAYLTGLPDRYRVPRRLTPRALVPAGSVAVADGFSGVYPRPSPGGWQLIGHTDVNLWDPTGAAPSPFEVGARVRFTAVA